jgi:hypothetical protein
MRIGKGESAGSSLNIGTTSFYGQSSAILTLLTVLIWVEFSCVPTFGLSQFEIIVEW